MKTFKQFFDESTRMSKEIEKIDKIVKDPKANLMDKVRAVKTMERINANFGISRGV